MNDFAAALRQSQQRAKKRPQIEVVAGRMPDVVDKAEESLIAARGGIYQRGGVLVRPVRTSGGAADDAIRRHAGALTLRLVGLSGLREAFDRAAAFVRQDGRAKALKAIDCPQIVAAFYLDRAGHWRLPTLTGIIEAPTLRRDGTVLQTPGYDAASGLLFDAGGEAFPSITGRPTRTDAIAALDLLVDIVKDFPFVSPADRAVALAAILTALVRASLRSSPLFGFSAPTMGSGKSLLADTVARIATGRDAPAMSQGGNRDEDQKVILSLLIAGDPIVLLDNCERPIQGDALCSVLTQGAYRGRLLGTNEQVTVPTATTFLATGNNLAFRGDMTSRALLCEIDPGIERPDERAFDRDLRAHVTDLRADLVVAGLTVLRAFVVAGQPAQDIKPFGRFEEWSALVRAALVWLKQPDPCETRDRIVAEDSDRSDLAALQGAWEKVFGADPVTAAEVIQRASDEGGDADLGDAVKAIASRGGHPTAKALGHYLRAKSGRVIDGRRFDRTETSRGRAKWRLRVVK